ncbi:hypothetical protein AAG906_015276 [Vitis piasezkii]
MSWRNWEMMPTSIQKLHDQLVSCKDFQKGQRVLLYDSKLHIFLGKLKSRWIGSFTIHQVHSNGTTIEAPYIPPSEGGVPTSPSSSAPQRRYETRRPATIQGANASRPQSSVRRPPAKKARTSGLGESSRASQPEPPIATHARAPADFVLPSNMSPGSIIRCPMLIAPPIEDSYGLLQRYYLEQLMTPREFFYPRVALHFNQSMTTCGVPSPTLIHFTLNGRHGILEARDIAEALEIPFEPRDMVRILSRGTSIDSILLRKKLPPGMLLVDVVLRSNLFPLQHSVQRRGAILDALFRISEGFYFGPHHLIMASLVHFEEKVHRKKLQRAVICAQLVYALLIGVQSIGVL